MNVPIFTYVSGLQLLLLIDPHVSLTIRHILKIYKSNCGTWAHEKLSTIYPHPSFRTYLFHMIVPIYGHIGLLGPLEQFTTVISQSCLFCLANG